MNGISRKRCFNHPTREAAARCPECGRFYCRECVTEHDDRVLCSACLTRLTETDAPPRRRLTFLARTAHLVLGVWISWLVFYYMGRLLMLIPSAFHEGVLWKEGLF